MVEYMAILLYTRSSIKLGKYIKISRHVTLDLVVTLRVVKQRQPDKFHVINNFLTYKYLVNYAYTIT